MLGMYTNIDIDRFLVDYPKPLSLEDYDELTNMKSRYEQKSIDAADEGMEGLASQYHNIAIAIQNYIYNE